MVALDVTVLSGTRIDVLAVSVFGTAVFDLVVVTKSAVTDVSRAEFSIVAVLIGLTTIGQLDHRALIRHEITVVGCALIGIGAVGIDNTAATDVLGMTLVGDTGVQRAHIGVRAGGIIVAASLDRHVVAHVVVTIIKGAHIAVHALGVLVTASLDRYR